MYRALRMVLTSDEPNIRYIEKHFNAQRAEDIIDKLRTKLMCMKIPSITTTK